MANPVFGEGTTLTINDGTGSAFAPVEDLTGVDPPSESTPAIQRKRLGTTNLVERVPGGLTDAATMSFDYETNGQKALRFKALQFPASAADKNKAFKITLPDGTAFAFSGFVLNTKVSKPAGGEIVMATTTVQLTSLVVITYTAPQP